MRIRTGYSFRTAVGSVKDVADRLEEINFPVFPISDRASTFGFNRWKKEAEKRGKRPIFGVELAVSAEPEAKKPTFDHWTFFAKDEIRSINLLLELATRQFHYEPVLSYAQAMEAEGVIKIAGNRSMFDHFSPQPDLYVGLSPSTSKGFIRRAMADGHKLIASSDNKFTRNGDLGLYEVICGRGASTQTYDQFIQSDEEWRASVDHLAEALEIEEAWVNRTLAMEACHAHLLKGVLLSPPKPKTLRQMCEEGAVALGVDIGNDVYAERLERELRLIDEKNFEDYFYIIADVVQWARERMIVGPARGSSCGSLVCYLLRITTIDPIPYGLIFERFIDINRTDLPDIDIDFSDQKRYMVFEYMEQKYGKDRVARLGTVAVYKPKSAIGEAGAALGIPKWLCDKALDSVIERSSGDARALQALEDTFKDTASGRELAEKHPEIMIAGRMEGHPRHHSQHAAGIVLTELPISHYVAIDSRTGATHCDKKDAEDLDLLKIDALGLKQLSVFEDALDLAGLNHTFLETLPLDDMAAFDVLNKGHFSGIFQFDGPALKYLTGEITVDNIEDIVSITALARPGPMSSGGSSTWTKRRMGKEPATSSNPLLAELTKDTYGVVVYQETVMNIVRVIGKMSWEDTSTIRKAMSKSMGDEFFEAFWQKFKKGAAENGIEEREAREIWDQVNSFGSWAFNRSHAVAYGLVSYWCLWLKAHYPLEFAAATLSHEKLPEKQIRLLRELNAEGIKYVPVDVNLSTDKWRVGIHDGENKLIGPVQNVKGIGPKLVQQIISARARDEPLPNRASKLLSGDPKTPIDSLWPIGDAIRRVMPDPAEKQIFSMPVSIADAQPTGVEREVMIFGVAMQIKPRDENEDIRVVKRGRKMDGPTAYLEMRVADDSGLMYCRVGRFDYERLGVPVLDRGRPGKALYAVKGRVPGDFGMINIKQIRYLGDMEEGFEAQAMQAELMAKAKAAAETSEDEAEE